MIKNGLTIREAAQEWVNRFNAIPQEIVTKLLKQNCDELTEVTPPSRGDRVFIFDDEHNGENGEIVGTRYDGEKDLYEISLDSREDGNNVILSEDEFDVERDDYLPIWGTLWSFGDSIDNAWLDNEYLGNGLQAMADLGFRIYEQEDYEYIFGIDGAGYDFYEAYWIPLYKARGLKWHDESTEGGDEK